MALRGEALRNMARSMFGGFYARGLSANQALAALRELGLGYRRKDFLADYRTGLGEWKQQSTIKFVNLDKVPSDNTFLPKYHGLSDKYGYMIKWRVYDESTLAWKEGVAWFFTDYKSTKRNIINHITQSLMERGKYGQSYTEVDILAGHINPYWEEF